MNNRVKTVQMAIGVDLLGSKLSLSSSKNIELEATGLGVVATSKGTGRIVLIPWPNVKGCEMFPDAPVAVDPNAPPKGKKSQ
jgi:hypothetical protein